MTEHAERVVIQWNDGWWTVSDEGGDFARATDPEQALSYARELMHGPPTFMAQVLRERPDDPVVQMIQRRHGATERLR